MSQTDAVLQYRSASTSNPNVGTAPPPPPSINLQTAIDQMMALLNVSDGEFSPEAVLAIAGTQLNAIDDEMRGAMSQLRASTAVSNDLRTVMNGLEAAQSHTADGSASQVVFNLSTTVPGTTLTYREVLERAGVDMTQFAPEVQASGEVTRGGAEHFVNLLRNNLSTLSDAGEQRSMQLQQLVNRRSQVTQLASNLLQSLHDTARAIIQNTH